MIVVPSGKTILKWAVNTFGEIALERNERARRFAEEASELLQSVDLSREDFDAILDRVYFEPKGEPKREFGQTLLCLKALAQVEDVDENFELIKEYERVTSIPKEVWLERHEKKANLGIAKHVK